MIAILNTTISIIPGLFADIKVDLDTARRLVAGGYRSHVGHESTARIVSTLLGVDVPFDRAPFAGGMALCFKLNGRPPEGRILTVEEIEAIGYTWRVLSPLARLPERGDRVRWVGNDACVVSTGTVARAPYVSVEGWRGPDGFAPGTVCVDVLPLPGDAADDHSEQAWTVPLARIAGPIERERVQNGVGT